MAVSDRTRRTESSPLHPVTAANAGAYSVADIAAPANTHPAKKHRRLGAAARAAIDATATTDPAVITTRGPTWSMRRPTQMPQPPEPTSARVKAATSQTIGQPSSALMLLDRTGKA